MAGGDESLIHRNKLGDLDAQDRIMIYGPKLKATQPNTTLADLLTLLFAANPFLTMRASLRR
jgi:hypothetical protein